MFCISIASRQKNIFETNKANDYVLTLLSLTGKKLIMTAEAILFHEKVYKSVKH